MKNKDEKVKVYFYKTDYGEGASLTVVFIVVECVVTILAVTACSSFNLQ